MDFMREWATAVCCACIIAAAVSMTFPAKFGKLSGTVISLMVLCVVFRPLTSLNNWTSALKNYSFGINQSANPELEQQISSNAAEIYASYLRQNLCRVLDWNDISYQSVEVIMDNSEDGCISIERVEVIVKDEDVDKSYRIKKLLSDLIGSEPEVRSQTQKGSE